MYLYYTWVKFVEIPIVCLFRLYKTIYRLFFHWNDWILHFLLFISSFNWIKGLIDWKVSELLNPNSIHFVWIIDIFLRSYDHPSWQIPSEWNKQTHWIPVYWYYDSTYFGQPFCPSSGVLSRTSALVHFCRFDDRLLPGAGRNILLLVANGHNCIKSTRADVRLRTPDYGQKGCPKHVVVILIKLEFSTSVGFIH